MPALSAEQALGAGTVQVAKRLFAQFPQLAEKNTDMRLMISEWALGLADMRPEEIARGLGACRMRKFAPSLGEFAQLCRPAMDPEAAFYEAELGMSERNRGRRGLWSHPAIWRAACAMEQQVREGPYSAVKKRWEFTLGRELEAGWGEEVPGPRPRIEHPAPEQGVGPSEEVRRQIDALLAGRRNRKNNGGHQS